MSGKRLHPELVIPELAIKATGEVKIRTELSTHYILQHYRCTGKLAPGCDFKDLLAWYEINKPDELAAVTRRRDRLPIALLC